MVTLFGVLGLASLVVSAVACAEPPPSPGPAAGKTISRADLGDKWPFTVDSGRVRCEDGFSIVFEADGHTYAVNGDARGRLDKKPWRDSREIVATNESGGLADVTAVIKAGQALCK